MTSTIAPKKNITTTTATSPETGMSTIDDAADFCPDASAPAATFDAASSSTPKKYAAFNPPPTPRLVAGDVDGNTEKIKSYNEQREAYLERYCDAAESSAVSDEVLRRAGPPVSYDNGVGALPVKERARYDKLATPALVNARSVYEALGDRGLDEKGVATKTELKGTFVEGQLTYKGNGGRGGRELTTDGEEKITHQAGMGLAGERGSVTAWVDPTNLGGAKSLEVNANNGALWGGIEASSMGKVTLEGGPMIELGEDVAEAKVGGHVAVDGNEVELGEVVSLGALGFEATARAGVIAEVADPLRGTRVDLNGKGFFDDKARLNAMRASGR